MPEVRSVDRLYLLRALERREQAAALVVIRDAVELGMDLSRSAAHSAIQAMEDQGLISSQTRRGPSKWVARPLELAPTGKAELARVRKALIE